MNILKIYNISLSMFENFGAVFKGENNAFDFYYGYFG